MSMRRVDCTPEEAAAIVSTICGDFKADDVEDTIFIAMRKCPNCGLPHVITVFGTPETSQLATYILARAIQRIATEGIFDD